MNHQTFNERLKNALKTKSNGQIDESVAELRALLHELVPAVKAGVNEWHQQQTLAMLVDTLNMAERVEECRAAWNELIELTDSNALYWRTARTSAQEDFERWNSQHPSQTELT